MLFSLVLLPAQAAAQAFPDARSALEWMNFYYQHPAPDRLPAAVALVADSITPEFPPQRVAAVAQLFSTSLRDHPRLWPAVSQISGRTPESRAFIQRVLEGARTRRAVQVNDPGDLDLLWMEFFVTGQRMVIDRLLRIALRDGPTLDLAAPFWVERSISDRARADTMLRVTAAWSLANNQARHPMVAETLRARRASATDAEQRRLLDEILANRISIGPAAQP